tara:strand:- start:597 stop:839 length:243 start_codon:yes stop_codon:yes gene_type:complete
MKQVIINYGYVFDNLDSAVIAAVAQKKKDIREVRVAALPNNKYTIVYVSGYSAGGVIVNSNQGNGKPFHIDEKRIMGGIV